MLNELKKTIFKLFELIVIVTDPGYVSSRRTKETLATGNLLSVINVLMQLRKVCNHPNLFEVRPILSPFQMESLEFHVASFVFSALNYDPFKVTNFKPPFFFFMNTWQLERCCLLLIFLDKDNYIVYFG